MIRQDEKNFKKRKAGKDLTPHKAQKHPRADIIHRNDRIKVLRIMRLACSFTLKRLNCL